MGPRRRSESSGGRLKLGRTGADLTGCDNLRRIVTNHRVFIDALTAACERAVRAVGAAPTPEAGIDEALDLLAEAGGSGMSLSLFLLEHDRLWAVTHRGYTMIPGGLRLDRGVIGRALERGGAQYVPDVRADPDYVPGKRGVVSELVLPISAAGRPVGVLNVETAFELPVEAAGRLEPVAAALAAPLTELRQAPGVDLSSLMRVFVHMSSLRDAREIAELAARSLAHVLGLEACQVTLADDAGGEIAAGWSRTGALDSLPSEVVEALRTHVDHTSVVELVDAAVVGLSGVAGGCRTLVWLPLRVNDVGVGELVGAARGRSSSRAPRPRPRRCWRRRPRRRSMRRWHSCASGARPPRTR